MRHFLTRLRELLQNALPELEPDQIQQVIANALEEFNGQRPTLIAMLDRCCTLLRHYGWMPFKDFLADNATIAQFRSQILKALQRQFPEAAMEDLADAFHTAYVRMLSSRSQTALQARYSKIHCYYYLRKAAINCHRSFYQRQHTKHLYLSDFFDHYPSQQDFTEQLIYRDTLQAMQDRVCQSLSPLHWKILLLYYQEGWTLKEIGHQIHKSPSQVCRMLQKAVAVARQIPPPRINKKPF